ncbi:MAG: isochorismatase family protein [Candidatus Eisenbacteria bacterium]
MLQIVLAAFLAASGLGANAFGQDADSRPVKPALLVVDIQNEYIPMMDETERDAALRMINGAIWQFRQFERPVIRVYHTDPQWGPEPGSEGFEFPKSVIVREDDPKVVKNYPSAFTKTDLDRILKELDANAVFICGLSATACVLATYFGALDHEYDAFLIDGAIMSDDAAHTETVKDIVNSVDWAGLELILRASRQAPR